MNKMLVAIFDSEPAALTGRQALQRLHAQGDITLYGSGVVARDLAGLVVVDPMNPRLGDGTIVGLGVGSLIGLLGGPAGVALGALAGTTAGAMRDFWVAGVGLDFVEEVTRHLRPGRVALVAEVEEEWVLPVDSALEAAGGTVFRRSRIDVLDAQLTSDMATLKGELKALEAEARGATADARLRLKVRIAATEAAFDDAARRGERRAQVLVQEAETKTEALRAQVREAGEGVRARVEARIERIRSGMQARSDKLGKAWALAKDALTV